MLDKEVQAWNGESVTTLAKLYQRHKHEADLFKQLIQWHTQPEIQLAASWLLKHALEDGQRPTAKQVERLYQQLPQLESWQSRLHLLQSIEMLGIPSRAKEDLETFLRHNLSDRNKFLRAWSYHGFYHLAIAFPQYQNEVTQFFEMALRDEPPSVISRVRKLKKIGFPNKT